MQAVELIGKKAIRTRPAQLSGGGVDRSFMCEPVLILVVTNDHIVCDSEAGYRHILEFEYVDDNWTSYDALMGMVKEVEPVRVASPAR